MKKQLFKSLSLILVFIMGMSFNLAAQDGMVQSIPLRDGSPLLALAGVGYGLYIWRKEYKKTHH
jgi:hypothetical protein